MSRDLHPATETWPISFVQRVKEEDAMIEGLQKGDRVIGLSESIAVKYGFDVMAPEATAQDCAYHHVDPATVHVPRVYCYFQDLSRPTWPRGYLFMEFVAGRILKDLELIICRDIVQQVAALR